MTSSRTAPTLTAKTARSSAASSADDAAVPWANRVTLCGRLTALPEPVELPSGDSLWRFRVTVERPLVRGAKRGESTPRRVVDAVDCTTAMPQLAARLGRQPVGAVVSVEGTLTRRFWRSPAGPASRYEVVVDRAVVTRRAAATR